MAGEHTFGLSKEVQINKPETKWLYSLTWTHSALLVGDDSCTLEQKMMKKVTSPFLFLQSLKAVQRGAALKLVGTV